MTDEWVLEPFLEIISMEIFPFSGIFSLAN